MAVNYPFATLTQIHSFSGSPYSDEFQINTTTNRDQMYSSVTTLKDGGFVVTWSSLGQDGSGWGIYGQRYSANGSPYSDEFQINTTTKNTQRWSSVTALTDGGFVVTWSSLEQDGSGWGIYGQQFDAESNKVGSEFPINQFTSGDQFTSGNQLTNTMFNGLNSIATLNNGNIVVTWHGNGEGDSFGIYAGIINVTKTNNAPTVANAIADQAATDTAGASVSDTFNLAIANTNDAPTLTGTKAPLVAGTEDTVYTIS